MFSVSLFTDGSCSRNGSETAVGGWCAILQYNGSQKVCRGYESHTTNNRMELRAVIEGIKALRKPCEVTVYTDSMYIITGINNMRKWLQSSTPRANWDLWQELISAGKRGGHHLTFHHVKGHNGHPMNERCDQIARQQTAQAK